MAEGLTDREKFLRRIEALALSSRAVTELPLVASPPAHHDGVMVALVPDDPEQLAVEGDEALPADDLHVTLCYLGKVQSLTSFDQTHILQKARSIVNDIGRPFSTSADGVVVMGKNDDGVPATALLIQSDEIVELYDALAEGLEYEPTYPTFIPHMTTGYGTPVEDVQHLVGQPINFNKVIVKFGDTVHNIPLSPALTAAPRSANTLDRVMDSLGRLWDEALHPRDGEGKFIKKNGAVSGKLMVPTRDRKGVDSVDANRASVVGFRSFGDEVWVLAEIVNQDGSKSQGFARATDVRAVAPVKARLDALYPIDDRGDSFINSSLERKRQLDLLLSHITATYGPTDDAAGAKEFIDSLGLWQKDLDYLHGGSDDTKHLGNIRSVDHEPSGDELDEIDDIIEDARNVKALRDRVHGLQERQPVGEIEWPNTPPELGGPSWSFSGASIDIAAAADDILDGYEFERGHGYSQQDWNTADTILKTLKAKDPLGFTVYHGRHGARDYVTEVLDGGSVYWPIGSATQDLQLAENYAAGSGPGVEIVFAIDGAKAAPYRENEFLLTGNYKITGHRWSSDEKSIVINVSPQDSDASTEIPPVDLEPHEVPEQQLLQGNPPDEAAIAALDSGADPFDVQTDNLLGAMHESPRFEEHATHMATGVSPISWMSDSNSAMGARVPMAGTGEKTSNRAYFVKQSIIGAQLGNTDIANEVVASLITEQVSESLGGFDRRVVKVPRSVFGDNPEWDGTDPPFGLDMADTPQPGHVISEHAAYLVPPGWKITDATSEETSFRNDIRDLDPAQQVDQTAAFYEDIGDQYGNGIAKMVLWDFVVLNGDRNPGNALLASSPDGSESDILAIDHGFAFEDPPGEGSIDDDFEWFMNWKFTQAWLNYVLGGLDLDNNVSEATLRQVIQDFVDAYGNIDAEEIATRFKAIPGVTDAQAERVGGLLAGVVDRISWIRDNTDTVLRALTERRTA